ncbi:MotA/TolQ/ExbB proton channel family protein [Pseudoalteromonas phenolica]|uniref:MotA/TolQ/ExbB proton channel family protein n=1 Tax=Pseudoalteromonas phenolica TaxID=161398 RepID=UPI00110A9AA0|nr:MotA/TolQ/ExbB proton channel family protein [Pseudoalteromonas phenolica]TMO57252.1 transporter [Pseudoalteromonas phenolica]
MYELLIAQLSNPIIFVMLILAIFCFTLIFEMMSINGKTDYEIQQIKHWNNSLKVLAGALPLLGLLGTINGLLSTFGYISVNFGLNEQELMSGGISDALFTTQLGLILAIPCILMIQLLNYRLKNFKKELKV